jgi:hypothetical protein
MPDAVVIILAVAALAALIAVLYFWWQRRNMAPKTIVFNQPFDIRFANGQRSRAVYVPHGTSPQSVQSQLALPKAQSTVFVIGGAGGMSDEDVKRTQKMVDVVAAFAQKHKLVVITGGTESGIMQMFGDSRLRGRYTFPLVGIAPLKQVRFPGYENAAAQGDLEDSHSHFVLVEGEEWGSESGLIQDLSKCISGYGVAKTAGILVNGGNIALNEIGMAVERGIPMFVVEGSGRTADVVATALRTGTAEQRILKAIVSGGEVQFMKTTESAESITSKLNKQFGVS